LKDEASNGYVEKSFLEIFLRWFEPLIPEQNHHNNDPTPTGFTLEQIIDTVSLDFFFGFADASET